MKKTKILLVSNHFYPYTGGLENYALNLGKKLVEKGFLVDVLTYKVGNMSWTQNFEGLKIIRLPCWEILGDTYSIPKIFSKKYIKAKKYLKTQKYDVVITNTRFFTITPLMQQFAKKNKSKHIHVEHGNTYPQHKNKFVELIAFIYDNTLGRYVFRKADIVVGISQASVDFAKKLGAKNTVMIPNSIDTKKFKKTSAKEQVDLRKKLKIKKEEKVIINGIGRLIYAKGLSHTLQAVKDMKNVVVITPGTGPYEKELKNIAKQNKAKAIFPGNLSQKEVIEYLSMADVFVNPSYSEGLPTCVLEAGAIGLSVIATDVGGTKQILENTHGILVKPKSTNEIKKQLLNIFSKKNETEKLKNKIKENFDIEKNTKKMIDIIEKNKQ